MEHIFVKIFFQIIIYFKIFKDKFDILILFTINIPTENSRNFLNTLNLLLIVFNINI